MRAELKYLVPIEILPDLRAQIAPFVYLDKHGRGYEEQGYTIRSIYLDTPKLTYYHEKQAHLQNRKKLRIRGYNRPKERDIIFLEIKRKFTNSIAKNRAPVLFENLPDLFRTGDIEQYVDPTHSFPGAREDACRFFYHVYCHNLRAANLVVYEREAFMGKYDPTLRITFDRNLRGSVYPHLEHLYSEEGFRHAFPEHFVLEVKYTTHFPGWLRPVIGRYGLIQRAVSKYCIVLDLFDAGNDGKVEVLANTMPLGNPGLVQRLPDATRSESLLSV